MICLNVSSIDFTDQMIHPICNEQAQKRCRITPLQSITYLQSGADEYHLVARIREIMDADKITMANEPNSGTTSNSSEFNFRF